MTMQEAQALANPFVRCLDGRIGQIIRLRASYASDSKSTPCDHNPCKISM